MRFLQIRVREDQDESLRKLPGSVTENIRRAIDEYIEKRKVQNVSASASRKEGDL